MKRRAFIAGVGSAVAWPVLATAQKRSAPIIGFLGLTTPLTEKPRVDAFVKRLGELGWIDGQTVNIEYRWAEGRKARYAELAAEFVGLNVDLIVTAGAASVAAVKAATSVIPVVFAIASDPVGTGIVESLARPGGNVTGLSYLGPDLAAKRLEFARELLPKISVLAIMANIAAPGPVVEMREEQTAAAALGIEVVGLEIQKADDIQPAMDTLKHRRNTVLYVCADPLVVTNPARIISLALDAQIPTIFGEREDIDAGGLMSYGPDPKVMYRRAAELGDKILRGAKAKDLPVEQPTQLDFVINLKTAKALGLEVSPSLLARADEVIE